MASTGLTLTSTSNLSSGQKILVASGRLAFEPAAPDPDLVQSERIPEGHKQWDHLIWGRLAQASALTEGVDLSSVQQMSANKVSITPSEHGIIVTLSTRLVRRQGDVNIVTAVGSQVAGSLRRRLANDIIALYDSFGTSSPGASSALDITHARGAYAYLRTDNNSSYGPAPLPFHGALHVEQISDIVADLTDSAPRGETVGMTEAVLQQWWRGRDRAYTIQFFESGNISRDTGDDAKGAIFARPADVLVMEGDAIPTEEEDQSLRATEYGLFQSWGESEAVDTWGVEIFSDAASTL